MTRKEATTYTGSFQQRVTISHFADAIAPYRSQPAADTRPAAISILDSIQYYYHTLDGAGREDYQPTLNHCFAIRLALLLMSILSEGRFAASEEGSFNDEFYLRCLQRAAETGLAEEIDDSEILLIGIKQCLIMMAAAGIVRKDRGSTEIDRDGLTEKNIHQRLFNAFWNVVPWDELFPSDQEAAIELGRDKNILRDLLARHTGAVSIDAIANEFFEMTGFTAPGDMEMISFLDFYFFAWLERFGLIRYIEGRPYETVRITVTEIGRNLLRSYS